MKAAEAGSLDIVLFLLREGCNPWLHDARHVNRTAVWYAKLNSPNGKISQLLEAYMAELTEQEKERQNDSVTGKGPDQENQQMN